MDRGLITNVAGVDSMFFGPFVNDTGVTVAEVNSLNDTQ